MNLDLYDNDHQTIFYSAYNLSCGYESYTTVIVLRNQDMQEVVLENNGEAVLRFAAAYGFRNIQNIVQKIKRGKMMYDFVEIMACPSGMVH